MTTGKFIDLANTEKVGVFDDGTAKAIVVTDEEKPIDAYTKIEASFSQNFGERSSFEKLKRTLFSVKEIVREAAIVIEEGNKLHAACFGGAGIMIFRGGRLYPLVKTAKGEHSTASGYTKPGDVFFAATHAVFERLSISSIEEKLSGSPDEAAKALGGELESQEGLLGLIIFKNELSSAMISPLKAGDESSEQQILKFKKKNISGPRLAVVNFIDNLLAKIPDKSLKVADSDYAFRTSKKRKTASIAGVILLLVLGVSIYFGVKAGADKRFRESYEPRLSEAEHNLAEAREIKELSPVRAQELVLEAQSIADALKAEEIEDERLENLIISIRESLGEIAGIYESDAELFLDLTLISSGFKGDRLAFSGETIRVLDSDSKKLVGVEFANKTTKVISGPDYLPDAIDTFGYDSRSFIVSSDGIREVTDEVSLVIKPDWDAERILAKAFAGNVYIIDKEKDLIWRYPGIRGGFLEPEEWLAPGISVELSDAIDMEIDGLIWVLSENGDIDNYSRGVLQTFKISGLRGSLGGASQIFTEEESENLYVLDGANSRIVLVEKANGQYLGEYKADKLANAQDMVVSEAEKKIVFLADDKLYYLELRH